MGYYGAAAQPLQQLKPVGLTDEQVAEVKELGKGIAIAMKKIRDDAGITAELIKKRAANEDGMESSE